MWREGCLISVVVAACSCMTSAPARSGTDDFRDGIDHLAQLVKYVNVTVEHSGPASMNTSQLITSYGYPVEEHTVTTEDGYILRLFRIPGKGPTVLIVHGIYGSSDDFLTLGREKSLPVLLAALGHDVWLGNLRGNKYSRKHRSLLPDTKAFWDFSWHEMGIYDGPAMVQHALSAGGARALAYLGHSQGTTVAYVMLSERAEYNHKISVMVSLASVSWISNMKSPALRALAKVRKVVEAVSEDLHLYEWLPHQPPASTLSALCASDKLLGILCATFLFSVYGYDYQQIDFEHIGIQFAHTPSGSSWKQILHYLQIIESGRFERYDYGPGDNLALYDTIVPPAYAVENISAKMAFIYSDNDWFSNFDKDVQKLINKLKNVVDIYKVAFEQFNHNDYLWGKNADDLVYAQVISLLSKYGA